MSLSRPAARSRDYFLLPGTAGAAESPRLSPSDARVAGLTYKQWDVKWTRAAAVTPTRSRRALFARRGGRPCGVQVGTVRMLPASTGLDVG